MKLFSLLPALGCCGSLWFLAAPSAEARSFGWNESIDGNYDDETKWLTSPQGGHPTAADTVVFTNGSGGPYTVTINGGAASGITSIIGRVTFQLNGDYTVGDVLCSTFELRGGGTMSGGIFSMGSGAAMTVDGAGLVAGGIVFDSISSRQLIARNGATVETSGQVLNCHIPIIESASTWTHSGVLDAGQCLVTSGGRIIADTLTVTPAQLDGGHLQTGPLVLSVVQANNASTVNCATASMLPGLPTLLEGAGTRMTVAGLLDATNAEVDVRTGAILSTGRLSSTGIAFFTIDGDNSQLAVSSDLGPSIVKIQNGGQASAASVHRARIFVNDAGSVFQFSALAEDSSLIVSNGGTASGGTVREHVNAVEGTAAGISADGAGSSLTLSGNLEMGVAGPADLGVSAGGRLESGASFIDGGRTGGVSTGSVHGAGSSWLVRGDLSIGDRAGQGRLFVGSGGVVDARGILVEIGKLPGSDGVVEVESLFSDAPSVLDARGASLLSVGVRGKGYLKAFGKGRVLGNDMLLGFHAGSAGVVEVFGAETFVEMSGELAVGEGGLGQMTIGGQAVVAAQRIVVGSNPGANLLRLLQPGAGLIVSKSMHIGENGSGQLSLEQGASLSFTGGLSPGTGAGQAKVGVAAGSTGVVTVTTGAVLTGKFGLLSVGDLGQGTLNITNKGVVQFGQLTIGEEKGSIGTATVSGLGSVLFGESGVLTVANQGQGTLNVTDGAQATYTNIFIGGALDGTGTLNVSGVGTTLQNHDGLLEVGPAGHGTLNVTTGGLVDIQSMEVGGSPGSNGTVRVSGTDSLLRADELVAIGGFPGLGQMSVSDAGLVIVGRTLVVDGPGLLSVTGGGAIVGDIDGSAIRDTVIVGEGGEFRLGGHFIGSVIVQMGGSFMPGSSPGKATVTGSASFAPGSGVEIELGGAESGVSQDVIETTGPVALGGRLEIVFRDGFAPANGQAFDLIRGSGITGDFAVVAVRGLAPGFTYTLTKPGGTTLRLTATSTGVPTSQPELTIAHLPTGDVEVSWPEYVTGWSLQQSAALRVGAWQPITAPGNRVSVPHPAGSGFFRLVRP